MGLKMFIFKTFNPQIIKLINFVTDYKDENIQKLNDERLF